MKLMKELLEAKEITGRCVVTYIELESMVAYDAISEVFKLFGYTDIATLDEYLSAEESDDYAVNVGGMLDEIGVWAPVKPTREQVIKSLDKHGIVIIGK